MRFNSKIVTCFSAAAGLIMSGAVSAKPFMEDDFETGDLSSTNERNFRWSGAHEPPGDNGTSTYVGKSDVRPGSDGDHALHFRYRAGSNWSEKRFELGEAERDLWIRYWLKVPENFRHGSSRPNNAKLFSIFMDDYSSKGDGPTVIWEFWGSGGSSRLSVHYSKGNHRSAGGHMQHTSFINYPEDQGRWMEIVLHVKAATSRGTNDGVIETYRRWSDESKFKKLHEVKDADMGAPPGGPNGWKKGYVMGYHNAAYSQKTIFRVDDIKFSSESLLDMSSRPMPPTPVE